MKDSIWRGIKLFITAINAIWSFFYLALAVLLIFGLSYLLGHSILDGRVNFSQGVLIGNDSAFALSLVYWFDRFFPKVPIWYPLQGMGVSLLYSYPMGTTFLIIILERLLSLSAVEVFRILSFLTFPLTALGIYFLTWVRLKRQTVGLIAAVFFLLSQASWLFQALHGIFAQSFSLILVAPTLLFFDLFLERLLKGKIRSFSSRLFFVITVLFMGITFLMHVVTAMMISLVLILWSLIRFWFARGPLRLKIILKKTAAALIPAFATIFLGLGLAAFWFIPFQSYSSLANREGLNTRSLSQLQEESLRLPSLLGTHLLGEGTYRYDFFFFATPVLIFFAVGTIAALISKKRKVFGFALIAIFFIVLTMIPIYTPFIASTFKFFFTAIYFRGLIPALILLPIVAAWGAWSLPAAIFLYPLGRLTKKLRERKTLWVNLGILLMKFVLTTFTAVVTVMVVFWSLKNWAHQPPPNPDFISSYKYQFQPYGPSLSDTFSQFLQNPKNGFSLIPKVSLSDKGMEGKTLLNQALDERLDIDNKTILDVSPYAAGGEIIQGVGLISDTRFINLYHYYASLIHGMWGYQAGVFYGKEPLYKSKNLLADLTDWYGLKYAVLTPGFDPFEKYEAVGWKPVEDFKENAGIEVWENPSPNGLYTVSRRPVVLVVSDFSKGGYDHVFRSGNLGALTYKNAWMVEGGKYIDNYSLSELSNFKGVILHSYSYRSRSAAWELLTRYVEQGGVLFVDTGWQYVAKDWGDSGNPGSFYNLPEPLPVSGTKWGDIGTSWDGVKTEDSLNGEVEFSSFDPPVWDGNPWGMAIADISDLRDGAQAILRKENKVLMAKRKFGKGEIIWSGINILAHMTQRFNEEEAKFLEQIITPALSSSEPQGVDGIGYKRQSPDDILFAFAKEVKEPFWLLFRESNSPYWQAKIRSGGVDREIPIYSGGPGFILLRLDNISPQDTLYLEANLSFKDGILAKAISILTLVFLLSYLFAGQRLRLTSIFSFFKNSGISLRDNISDSVNEEEVY